MKIAGFGKVAAATAISGIILATTTPTAPFALAQTGADLAQLVSADETVASLGTPAVMEAGHADMGLIFDGSQAEPLSLLVRDDSGEKPVWRYPADLVFAVGDAAIQTLPDNSDYSFVGAKAGSQVWVIPQTQITDVPWLGWNTQSPSLLEAATRGVNMTFTGHQGPGEFAVFLQNGGFEKPEVLYSSTNKGPQSAFVEMNAHTHANWTFSEPGIHLVNIKMTTTSKEGTELSAEGILRFAVGTGTDTSAARDTSWEGNDAAQKGKSSYVLWLGAAAVLVLALIAVGIRKKRS
ncbi:choice-of-anchor M domain-containing protein [Corynebacterium caspium]|uniref:choice-of-anchor M domain-containing protein n=1 Tax=Corynebacterium caspium TaxID=234828 RepID=UPI001461701F|nr:choice-of-anchor M domain-containing protein [Corynebacterium caspium]WKD58932.1 hypothetical protein CCASP_02625 [Corynebacterium caspium DSM 44850]